MKDLRKLYIPISVFKNKKTTRAKDNVRGINYNNAKGFLQLMEMAFMSEDARLNFQTLDSDITANAGGGQANATQLSKKGLHIVETVASANDSVKLPKAELYMKIKVINKAAADLVVFVYNGDSLEEVTNDSVTLTTGQTAEFIATTSSNWITV